MSWLVSGCKQNAFSKTPVWKAQRRTKRCGVVGVVSDVAGLWGDLDRDFAPEAVIGIFQPGVGKRDVGE
jgi:hypothetical protein